MNLLPRVTRKCKHNYQKRESITTFKYELHLRWNESPKLALLTVWILLNSQKIARPFTYSCIWLRAHQCKWGNSSNTCEYDYTQTPDKRHILTSAESLSVKLIRVDVWIKPVMAVGNWNRDLSISVSLGTLSSVSVWQWRGGETLKRWSTITLICGSIKLLMRTNCAQFETRISGEMFEFLRLIAFVGIKTTAK